MLRLHGIEQFRRRRPGMDGIWPAPDDIRRPDFGEGADDEWTDARPAAGDCDG
jgi:hypothetical protein